MIPMYSSTKSKIITTEEARHISAKPRQGMAFQPLNSIMVDRRVVYRDIDLRFRPNPSTGDIPVLLNGEAVKSVVRNVTLTNHYEVFMRPLAGGNIRAQLFENIDKITEMIVRSDIKRALATQVPEAEVLSVTAGAPEFQGRNSLNAQVTFKVRNLQIPVEVKLFLGRVR